MTLIVVHYKELALKGRNRPWFIQLLVRNIKDALKGLPVRSVRSVAGRIEIDVAADTNPESQIPNHVLASRLARVFGIANFSVAKRAAHDFNDLARAILEDLGDRSPESFRLSATRQDKRLPFTSPQVEREVGGLIKQAKGWRVDLGRPALTISSTTSRSWLTLIGKTPR